jgi:CheY-like chemotaxis protein
MTYGYFQPWCRDINREFELSRYSWYLNANVLKPRILVIEDDPDDELLLMHMLQKTLLEGRVGILRDGRDALTYLANPESEAEELIAIFLDLNLPSMNGLQLLGSIRLNSRIRHLPVVVMTSSNSPQDLDNCRRLGVSSYVQKPINFSMLTKVIADGFHAPGEFLRHPPAPR